MERTQTLEAAVDCGNWVVVRDLLCDKNVDVADGARAGNTDSQGMSVLHRLLRRDKSSCKPATSSFLSAAFCSSSPRNSNKIKLPFAKLRVRNGVNINTKDQKVLTALQLALLGKHWFVVQLLLKSGVIVDQNNPVKGKSLFHELAMDPSVGSILARSVTEQLVVYGINVNERDTQGDTPVNLAAKCGNWDVVRILLEHGADASLPDSQGWFVCHRLAKENSHWKHGADASLPDSQGWFVCHRLARENSHWKLSGERLSRLLLLLTRNGFQVNQTGPDGKSCVQLSIEHRHWELFWWLAEFGVAYCFTLKEKKTILESSFLLTTSTADENKLRTLILHVAETDDFSCQELLEHKNEALQKSFLAHNWVVAKALVQCGADIGINVGGVPLMHFLISTFCQSWPFDFKMYFSLLDALLAKGADIDCNGISILRDVLDLDQYLATKYVQFFIDRGISTYQPALTETFSIPSQSGSIHVSTRSPTQRAFEKKYVKAFEMLVESGASSNRELFELNTRYQAELSSRDKTTAETQMLDILNHAASQPRSLKSLCRLTVSHALGCGPRRMERVESLPLPAALHDYVLFSDLLQITRFNRRKLKICTSRGQNLVFRVSHLRTPHGYRRDNYLSPRYSYGYDTDDYIDLNKEPYYACW